MTTSSTSLYKRSISLRVAGIMVLVLALLFTIASYVLQAKLNYWRGSTTKAHGFQLGDTCIGYLARLYPYQAAKASVWMKRSKRARGISTISGLAGDR